ncbi:hypothetical protein A3Q56_06960 [Intoshia linei]|uniref:C-1-tetrahydrofolate synthase, cytoplasmic n=1 Tax=Intoshia linei TaxID=1819745 RepID=A0A177AVS5_9BILA|nr:hypothetical protein A3Q56_06960 [Intoshia linei]
MEKTDKILNGTKIAQDIKSDLKNTLKNYPSLKCCFKVIQVGGRKDSEVYINQKLKAAKELGIKCEYVHLDTNISHKGLMDIITDCNQDKSVHGFMLQLPFQSSENLNENDFLSKIDKSKDIDGLSYESTAKIATGLHNECTIPCAAQSCLILIKETNTNVIGKHAVVLGRSKVIGMPIANILSWLDATVTLCHNKTVDIENIISQADILIIAIGCAKFVKGAWIKEGAIVIDCGINYLPDTFKKNGYQIIGDVDFDQAYPRVSYITPVPGGVGPITVACLLKNVVKLAIQQQN